MRRMHVFNIALMILLGSFVFFDAVFAGTDVVDKINITVPVSCTMSGTGMTSHNADITNGTSNSAIGETTIKAYCNDNTGFSIYAIGYTDNEDGKNVLTNSTLGSTYDITTGTATSGNDSKWAMKLSTITSPVPTYPIIIAGSGSDTDKQTGDLDYSSFQEVPDDYTKVAYRKASTDIGTNAEGSTLKTAYQVYISKTQPAGTYSGQVKYTLVHPHDTEAPFACKPNGTTISTIVCMQDISSTNKSTILASMVEEQQYTLRDKRDGKTYTVSKLKDGNIWMTQNLDLDLDFAKTYTNEDTDLGWNGTGYGTASWTPLRSTYATGVNTWCKDGNWNTQYDYCQNNYTPESYDPGDLYWNGTLSDYDDWEDYRDGCVWDSTTDKITCNEAINPIDVYVAVSGTPVPEYHVGNYYNWTAAIAMNNSGDYITNSQDVNQSICPAGWTLPKGGDNSSSGSFRYLLERYGLNSSMISGSHVWDSALRMPLGGDWYGAPYYIGATCGFWSSFAYDLNSSYYASIDADDYFGYISSRGWGVSVRCVAR